MVSIRLATLADIRAGAKLHVDTWRDAYRGIMPQEYLDSLRYEDFEQSWRKSITAVDENRIRLVAEQKDQLMGFLGAGPSRTEMNEYLEELYGIYTTPTAQGTGIGKMMLSHYIRWLLERNKTSFHLWVLQENKQARKFYESVDGTLLEKEKIDRSFGGKPLVEVAYGWQNLSSVLKKLST